jgi:predicted nucleotidyltransferase component of viral defense system
VIPQRNISLLSNRLAANGDVRIREDVLERDYCLAWFLCCLAESDLKPVLAFKGGTALKRCYFGDYRFSEDLDFTPREPLPFEEIRARLGQVYAAVQEQSGITFAFEREDPRAHANSYTFYLSYTGPLPRGSNVKVDITINELVAFPLVERAILRGYEEFSDLPDNRSLLVYSLEEIAAEKILALADPARNEPRDLYDLWHLTENEGMEVDHLIPAICQKLEFRSKACEGLQAAIGAKEARLYRRFRQTGQSASQRQLHCVENDGLVRSRCAVARARKIPPLQATKRNGRAL